MLFRISAVVPRDIFERSLHLRNAICTRGECEWISVPRVSQFFTREVWCLSLVIRGRFNHEAIISNMKNVCFPRWFVSPLVKAIIFVNTSNCLSYRRKCRPNGTLPVFATRFCHKWYLRCRMCIIFIILYLSIYLFYPIISFPSTFFLGSSLELDTWEIWWLARSSCRETTASNVLLSSLSYRHRTLSLSFL
jgi:hypothetical protein